MKPLRDTIAAITGLVLLVTLVAGATLFFLAQKRKQWESFKAEHNCKAVAERSEIAGVGEPRSGGFSTFSIRPQVAWLCDDGRIYWKDKL